ncbi:MAG: hypothetical protein WAO41_08610 [Candidatus Nanopelagicales bacterium]
MTPISRTQPRPPRILYVCTGNATRSVIAASLTRRERPEWTVTSAGTFAIPGLPSSVRTLAALDAVNTSAPGHRSTTLNGELCDQADVVVAFERDHVQFIRRMFPAAAARTITLPRLVFYAQAQPAQTPWALPESLGDEPLATWDEIDDPAGGDIDTFVACAQAIEKSLLPILPILQHLHSSQLGQDRA